MQDFTNVASIIAPKHNLFPTLTQQIITTIKGIQESKFPIMIALMFWYSAMPYLLPSRPTPLSLTYKSAPYPGNHRRKTARMGDRKGIGEGGRTPPKGDSGAEIFPVFTPTIPHSSAAATLQIRLKSLEKKYPARPNSVSFAISMTS